MKLDNRNSRLGSALAVMLMLCGDPLAAADTAYMTLSVQGNTISDRAGEPDSLGPRAQEGHADEILVIGFGSRVLLPTDPASGQVTGQRRYEPFRVRKYIDRTSPLLAKALATNELVNELVLRLFRTSVAGAQEHYYTIRLTNGRVVDLSTVRNPTTGGADALDVESVAFEFQTITWTFEPGGIEFSDSLQTQSAAAAGPQAQPAADQ